MRSIAIMNVEKSKRGPIKRPLFACSCAMLRLLFLLLCFWSFSGRSRFPVVEIMGDIVAISAFREFSHDTCRMLLSMAVLAFRDHLVLFLMTGCAVQGCVLCLGRLEEIICFAVACRAVYGSRVSCIRHDLGHMRLMAFLAISRGHIGGMGLVALRAFRCLTVNAMACGAVEG